MSRNIYIIGENHLQKILTFVKIQRIKIDNPGAYLFFGEYGMKDNYKEFDSSIEVIEGSQLISDISMIIYAFSSLVYWDRDKRSYPIIMSSLINKNIFRKEEYIKPDISHSDWINNSKELLRNKIAHNLKSISIPNKIITSIITYLETDNWQDALKIMEKVVNFSIFRKILEYNDEDKDISFIIIVGNNHIEHFKTLFPKPSTPLEYALNFNLTVLDGGCINSFEDKLKYTIKYSSIN